MKNESSRPVREELWLHVNLAQLRNTPAELQQRLHAVQNAHMREADFLDELEFGVL